MHIPGVKEYILSPCWNIFDIAFLKLNAAFEAIAEIKDPTWKWLIVKEARPIPAIIIINDPYIGIFASYRNIISHHNAILLFKNTSSKKYFTQPTRNKGSADYIINVLYWIFIETYLHCMNKDHAGKVQTIISTIYSYYVK
jgi:hypothetical protein